MRNAGQDAAVLSDPASLAWLFNIRGADVEFCPVALGYGLLNADGTAMLFMAGAKLPPETRAHLGDAVTLAEREALPAALAALAGKTVRYDPASMPVWFKTQLEQAGAKIAEAADPVALPRATKNAVEQDGTRAAHLRDGAAMVRFLGLVCGGGAARRVDRDFGGGAVAGGAGSGAAFQGREFSGDFRGRRAWRDYPLPGEPREQPRD